MYKDVLKGRLDVSNYDVLLVPDGVGDGEFIVKGFNILGGEKMEKNISNFIKDGGDYVGICGRK